VFLSVGRVGHALCTISRRVELRRGLLFHDRTREGIRTRHPTMSPTDPEPQEPRENAEGETLLTKVRRVAVVAFVIAVAFSGYGWYRHRRSIADAEQRLIQASQCFDRGHFERAVELARRVYEEYDGSARGRQALRLMVVAENELKNKRRTERRAALERKAQAREFAANSLAIEIDTAPAGATVSVDGKPSGKTPLFLTVRKDRTLKLRLSLAGHVPVELAEKPTRRLYEFVLALEPTWKLKLAAPVTHSGTLARDNGVLIVPDRSGRISAVDLTKRRLRFQKLSSGLAGDVGRPIVYDDMFVVADRSGAVRAFDAGTGALRWTCTLRGPLLSESARVGDAVLVASERGDISAVHRDGEVIKSIRIAQRIVAAPVSDGEHLGYVLDTTGRCHAVDDTGRPVWSVVVPESGVVAPAIAQGRLLIAADDNRLHAFDARNGKRLWTVAVGGALRVAPAFFDGRIYVVTENREILELRSRDGRRLRARRLPGRPSAPVANVGGALLVPVHGHGAFVIAPDSLKIEARVAPGLTSEVPVIATNDRDLIFASDSGWLLGYRLR